MAIPVSYIYYSLVFVFSLSGLILFYFSGRSLKRKRPVSTLYRGSMGLLFFFWALILILIGIGGIGYRTLTREELAAEISIIPRSDTTFLALVDLGNTQKKEYELAGDQLYIDAKIIKWHPWVNLLGIHTAYKLSRIGGRYRAILDERRKPRTIYSISSDAPYDIFEFRLNNSFMRFFCDAEYGSGTFFRAEKPMVLQVFVSTTGLLVRPKT